MQPAAAPPARSENLPILWDVVEEHLDEAAFLYTQWERALRSPSYKVEELRDRLEERMLAHVDGLVVAGEAAAERLLIPALSGGQPDEACAAALALLASGGAAGVDAVCDTLQAAGTQRKALIRALALSAGPQAEVRLRQFLGAPQAMPRALALDVLSFQRRDVRGELARALQDVDPEVTRAGLAAAMRLAPSAHLAQVRQLVQSPDAAVQEAALCVGAVAGLPEVPALLRAAVRAGTPGELVRILLALLGDAADCRLLMDRAVAAHALPADVFALGFCGTVEAAELCVELARDPRLAAVAAEAIVGITGVDLEKEKLVAAPAAGADEELESADAELAVEPEDELPVPDAEALAGWWQRSRSGLAPGTRYVAGRPVGTSTLLDALAEAPLRRCHALGLDLAIRSRGTLQVETWGLARDQAAKLRELRAG